MFKKIISLMLVACMVLALGVTVSAEGDPTMYLKATDGKNAGEIYVIVAIKDNTVSVDEDESGAIEEPEFKGGVTAFELAVEYDAAKFELSGLKKLGKDEGAYTVNKNAAKSVWVSAGGLYLVNDDGIAEGIADYDLTQYTFKVKADAITEEDYGKTFEFKFTAASNATGADVDFTPATYTIEDTREPIAGLVATAKTDLVYTGEVIDAASTITVNTAVDDKVTYKSEPAEIKNAGTYKVTATVSRSGCKATDVSADVVIGKADTTITLASDEITYGETEYTKDFTVAEGVDKAEITVADYAVADFNAGDKEITATATSANYNVTVTPGKLTVAPKAITAKVKNATKVYGEADPAFEAEATGLVGEDTLTYTYNRAEGENVGKYAINATAANPNYTVTVTAGELEITKKAATIKVQDEFQVLGNGKLTSFKAPVFEGLVGNDAIEVTEYVVENWADAEGNYALTVTYVANDNYNITVVPGNYAVKSAIPVSVTFGENKKTYGDADGEILVTGDLDLVTITKVKGLEKAAAGTYEDAYEVTLKAAEDANGVPYALVITNNKFVIEPKAATITVAAADKKVGAADPAFTFTAEGFLEGEAPAEVAFSRTEGETAGEYDITATYADPNYAITVVGAKLTISKYALAVKAKDVVAYVGKTIPALTAEITGAAEGDTITPAFTVKNAEGTVVAVEAIDTSVEAVYTIEVTSDANADKYDVTYTFATLTVRKASGRPSGGGSVIKPATKPAEDKEDAKEEDKEDKEEKPAASANIAIKEDAKDVNFAVADAENKFNPDVNASRNDVVAVLGALFNVTDVQNAPEFTDSADETVKALAAAGVINGYEDGSFQGEKDITRAEFVKLLAAALKLEAVEGAEANFSDIEGHWAAEWVKTFVAKGYLVGYPDGTFRPEANITRAEMVVVATRVAGSVAGEAAVEFADVDASHWAYDFIMKAAK